MPDRRLRATPSLPPFPTPLLRERPPASASPASGGRDGRDGHDGRDAHGSGGDGGTAGTPEPGTDRGTAGGDRADGDRTGGDRPSGGRAGEPDNPFAPPPEGRPDQEWRPRGGRGEGRGGGEDGGRRPSWGSSRWSSRQPGRQSGGFGGGRQDGPGRSEGPGGPGELRWDPTDPNQRRARYAMVAGMWGFILALFSLPEIALLLGSLALYWGISSLRGRAQRPESSPSRTAAARPEDVSGTPDTAAGPASGPAKSPSQNGGYGARSQKSAAVSGLVTGSLALAVVATTYTFQIVYRDYYTCVDDALTRSSQQQCEELLPERLRPLLGVPD
ncbi:MULTISPECIES: hypothetical protein [Streptomyces]|uniref:Uncharacterized protein n=1 Tax=Streptomyces fradiae TaxID=1906 RepID=A0ACC4W4W5_STRFR|nr:MULTISPECIES: hypothetical protein [Streptomyces]KNE79674.1 hypothetical protein ADZ36_26295 [Streptomyces fradiae]